MIVTAKALRSAGFYGGGSRLIQPDRQPLPGRVLLAALNNISFNVQTLSVYPSFPSRFFFFFFKGMFSLQIEDSIFMAYFFTR